MTYTDEQYEQFYRDLYHYTGKESKIIAEWGASIHDRMIEAGYQIEFPTLRYRVERYGLFYNIVDTEKDETAGCYSTRYFDNAEQMAQDFADYMNEAVEQRTTNIQDTTCSGGPVSNEPYNVKYNNGWHVYYNDVPYKGPFNTKALAEDQALILNDAAYWRRVATRADTTFLINKGSNNRWFVYEVDQYGHRETLEFFDTYEQAAEYRDSLGGGTGRW